eukprot:7185234-Prymnesium_polylepis.3
MAWPGGGGNSWLSKRKSKILSIRSVTALFGSPSGLMVDGASQAATGGCRPTAALSFLEGPPRGSHPGRGSNSRRAGRSSGASSCHSAGSGSSCILRSNATIDSAHSQNGASGSSVEARAFSLKARWWIVAAVTALGQWGLVAGRLLARCRAVAPPLLSRASKVKWCKVASSDEGTGLYGFLSTTMRRWRSRVSS